MRRYLRLLLSASIALQQALAARADDEAFMFFQEEVLGNAVVSIASLTDTSLRETPGIVSVITREDIRNSGAQDLLEVLTLLVPGFNFGNDVEGVVSAHFRGIWAEEGKILLLVDGLEMNERVFGTTQFGNHFNMDSVEKIEVIRGPGSAIYGGFAELAVINIITRGAKENAAYAAVNNAQMSKDFLRRGVSAGYGKTAGDFSSSLHATYSRGHRSQNDITDFAGDTRRLSNQLDLSDVNLHLGYKGLSFRGLANAYHTTQMDLWGANYTGAPYDEDFDTYIGELKYDHKATDSLTLTPRLEYKRDHPWVLDAPDQAFTSHKRAERATAGLTGLWKWTDKTNLLGGAEYSRSDVVRPKNAGPFEETFRNGKNRIGFDNFAGFLQLMADTPLANLTLGARYDALDDFGAAFVPRVALTKVMGPFHFKAMASQSFRSPVGILTNRTLPGAPELKAEKATNYETEAGYRITKSLWWVVNAYHVTVKDPIVYGTDPATGVGNYSNFGKIGTRGVESELRARSRRLDFTANYAYYDVTTNNVSNYAVPGHPDHLIGAPAHRVNAVAGLKFTPRISLHPSLSHFSRRHALIRQGAGVAHLNAFTIYNANLVMRDLAVKGMNVSLGVRDIFDRGYDFPPGYNNLKGVLPGPSRAYTARVAYTHPF